MGSPAIAVPSLERLLDDGYDILRVYSQPPRRAGRGYRQRRTPVHERAAAAGLDVETPASLRDAAPALAGLAPAVIVVVAYGLLLPPAVLAVPALGCVNLHMSLLPRWRGAAPIQHAILAGDTETGVTLMQMDAGLDTGPVLAQCRLPVGRRSTTADLHDRLAAAGAGLLATALPRLGSLPAVPQPATGATRAARLDRNDGRLDWSRCASDLDRAVRALNPWPGTWCEIGGRRCRILAASPECHPAATAAPGTVIDKRLGVACGEGVLRLHRLQAAGRKPVEADAFLRGSPVHPGDKLG